MKTGINLLVVLLAIGSVACERAQPNPTTVLLVRHAEKASDEADSPLTESGVRRSHDLVRVAEDAGVDAIYSSQFRRSRDTAKPLSERLGIPVTERPVNLQDLGDYGRSLAEDILRNHAGGTVVVIGHGNTVAATIEGLTGRAVALGEVQYGDLFIVTVGPPATGKVIKARYGL